MRKKNTKIVGVAILLAVAIIFIFIMSFHQIQADWNNQSHVFTGTQLIDLGKPLVCPMEGELVSGFGYRIDPISRKKTFHYGIDIHNPEDYNASVKAAAAGQIIFAGQGGAFGKVVTIQHDKNLVTMYAHLTSVNVSAGDDVKQGDIIGVQGRTGRSYGIHLHFEAQLEGKKIDPIPLLKDSNSCFK